MNKYKIKYKKEYSTIIYAESVDEAELKFKIKYDDKCELVKVEEIK